MPKPLLRQEDRFRPWIARAALIGLLAAPGALLRAAQPQPQPQPQPPMPAPGLAAAPDVAGLPVPVQPPAVPPGLPPLGGRPIPGGIFDPGASGPGIGKSARDSLLG